MKDLQIKNVKIDNFHEIHDKFYEFKNGFNVIYGNNEVGKSTLLEFIKNILLNQSNAEGYLNCLIDNDVIKLDAKKKSKKANMSILESYDFNNFIKVSLISLDDLMQAGSLNEDELIDMIRDNSGKVINEKLIKYRNDISNSKDSPLTPTMKVAKPLREQFNVINNLENDIKNKISIQGKFDNLSNQLEVAKEEFEVLKNKKKYLTTALDILKLNEEIKSYFVNEELLNHYEEYQETKDKFAEIKNINNIDLTHKLDDKNEEFENKYQELIKINYIEKQNIADFDTSFDNVEFVREIENEENNINNNLINYKKDLEICEEELIKLNIVKNEIKTKLEKLNIADFESYERDYKLLKNCVIVLEKSISQSMNVNNKIVNNFIYFWIVFLVFNIFLLVTQRNIIVTASCVMLLLSAIIGIYKSIKLKITSMCSIQKSEIDNAKKDIGTLLLKYNPQNTKADIYICNLVLDEMSDKINSYKDLLLQQENNKKSLKEQLIKKENAENFIEDSNNQNEEIKSKIRDFEKKFCINDYKLYINIKHSIDELKNIKNSIFELETKIQNYYTKSVELNKCLEDFCNKIHLFEVYIKPTTNEEYIKTFTDIDNLITQSSSNKKIIEEKNKKIKALEEQLENLEEYKFEDISEEQISSINSSYASKSDEIAIIENDLKNYSNEESVAELKVKYNCELSKIVENISKLFTKILTLEVITKLREEYNNQQPNFTSARKYLKDITNGKYNNIDFDNRTISGENIGEKEWKNLSRGTKEQLYLSLRLGYIENYIHKSIQSTAKLPIIIDDAFVNFDYERTVSIIRTLSKLSENNQIIYLTCHAESIDKILQDNNIVGNMIRL